MAKISVPLLEVRQQTIWKWLPRRERESHKGDYGRLLLVCGSVGYTGAPVLAGHIDVLRGAACPVVVTPHAGEFQRLFGVQTGSRLAAAKEFYAQTGATLLLKGHRSLIVGAEGCYVNRCGNPGMATGGSGDVLAGIVTALLGQGLSPTRAAAAAAWLHGTAGDLCAAELGEYGMLPSDLLLRLPRLLP